MSCNINGLIASTLDISNTCTIRSCTLITESAASSIGDTYGGSGRSAIIEDAKVVITGNNKNPSFGKVAIARFKGCVISKPKGARFDIASQCIVSTINGERETVYSDIVIEPMAIVSVADVKITPKEATLKEGEEITLTGQVMAEDATAQGISWSSSDPYVATVSQAGKVKALRKGKCQIIAKSLEDGSDKQDVCSITVKRKEEECCYCPREYDVK